MSAVIPGEQPPWIMLKNSRTPVRCSSQTARAPKKSEACFILPVRHSLACNPVWSMRTNDRVYQTVDRSILLYGYEARCGLLFTIINHNHNQVRDVATTSIRQKDDIIRPHSKRETQRLCAISGTAASPSPYKYTNVARAKKAPLVWSRCKTSRR